MSKQIHVIINPASGTPEPILHILNAAFRPFDINWSVSVTHQSGDALRLAREAAVAGVDVVAAYGGDGTIMEVANALAGGSIPLGILPGGTGNGLAKELQIPVQLAEAAALLAQSTTVRKVDLGLVNGHYSILHTYIGLDESQQAPRDSKERLKMLAYVAAIFKIIKEPRIANYQITIDGVTSEGEGIMCLVTNAIGLGLTWNATSHIRPDDGLLDVLVFKKDILSIAGDLLEEWREPGHLFQAGQGREITVKADPPQPVFVDGELIGETPVTAVIAPKALPVIVPA
jgi:YegS/Rv2252/BmrU family lipid kinase